VAAVPAAVPVAAPAPVMAQRAQYMQALAAPPAAMPMQAMPMQAMPMQAQPMQLVQVGQAAAASRWRIAFVLDWFRVPVPFLRPAAVPAATVEPEPETMYVMQPPAAASYGAGVAPVLAPAMPPPVMLAPPSCSSGPAQDTAAMLQRAVEELQRAVAAQAAACAAKK
jgi:hypothetical protein